MADDNGYHLSLSIGRELFTELLGAALPYRIGEGRFDLGRNLRQVADQLQLRQRVAGLLTERRPPEALVRVKDKAFEVWDGRRDQVFDLLSELVQVDGTWSVQLAREGSTFEYGEQSVTARAWFELGARGTVRALADNVELPFDLRKRVGAEIRLGSVRFDGSSQAVVGEVDRVAVRLGDHPIFQPLEDLLAGILTEQAGQRVNPVPLIRKAQLDELLGGAASALKLKMEVDDLRLEIGPEYMTLKVRFGFRQLQLEG